MVNGKVSKSAKEVRAPLQPTGNLNIPAVRSRHETRPYHTDARTMAFQMEEENHPMVNPQPNHSVYPSERSLRRWREQDRTLGHYRPHERNGGREASVFVGEDIILLATFRCKYPHANCYELIAFIWNTWGRYQDPPRFYDPSQITRAEQNIGLSRKRAAKTARQANTPRVQNWRHNYWNCPLPLGIANVRACDMIDMDEAVVTANEATRKYGKGFLFERVRYYGPYAREGGSVRLIMGISGDAQLGYRWAEIEEQRGGTTFLEFYNMVDRISLYLQQQQPGRLFVFLMDNLNVHHNPMISMLLLNRGHAVVYRPPYTPEDGPIEFVFNVLESELVAKMPTISNAADVRRTLEEKVQGMTEFSRYFHHCGYR